MTFQMHTETEEEGPGGNKRRGVVIDGITPRALKLSEDKKSLSCLELLLANNEDKTVGMVLDLEFIRKIENFYVNISMFIYGVIIVLHVLYMSLFSYSSVVIMGYLQRNESMNSTMAQSIFHYVVPIEPIGIVIYYMLWIIRTSFTCAGSDHKKKSTADKVVRVWSPFVVQIVFVALVVASFITCVFSMAIVVNNLLSLTLLVGWLTTLSYIQGVRPLRVFWDLILRMIVHDVYKVLVVYLVVLISFSFAFHIQFQISKAINEKYITPFQTMYLVFELMFGTEELFDDDFKSNIEKGGGSTVMSATLFVLYILLGTVILLNLLIAMMNTSYQEVLNNLKTC